MTLGAGTLYLVATPIGNLGDVSARARRPARGRLRSPPRTRGTRAGCSRTSGIVAAASVAHATTSARVRDARGRLERGETVALVGDAGSPGVSDPGARVVRGGDRRRARVRTVPGPVAVVGGAVGERAFRRERLHVRGLPAGARGARAAAAGGALAGRGETVVLYEAPHRVRATLEAIAGLRPGRPSPPAAS